MAEKSFHEKYITWRTKEGAVDILLITVVISLLLIIPMFQFLVSAFYTMNSVDKTKEVLEIASISTYTKLNQESLGTGILEIDDVMAAEIFDQQIDELIADDYALHSMINAEISITGTGGEISIESSASIMSAFNKLIHVENSLEFIIDPIMEE